MTLSSLHLLLCLLTINSWIHLDQGVRSKTDSQPVSGKFKPRLVDTERNPGQEKSSEKTERKGEKSPRNVKKKKAERDEDKFETSTKERIYN